jgi:hypothetical protein
MHIYIVLRNNGSIIIDTNEPFLRDLGNEPLLFNVLFCLKSDTLLRPARIFSGDRASHVFQHKLYSIRVVLPADGRRREQGQHAFKKVI